MPHIQGASREEVLLFPPSLDEYITDNNPVRFIDAFVDQLDLQALGFTRAIASPRGRPPYHPADLLKLYVYGYLNHVRSSRLLERETHRNVELMWLLKKLTPDFKTIADFRKDNLQPLRDVCRAFTLLCKELDLFGGELVAIDGSKFAAVNNRGRNFTSKKLERTLLEIDAKIAAYLSELDTQDAERHAREELKGNLQEKIAALQARREQYLLYQQTLAESGASQLSLTDPDCRSMPVAQGTIVGYNAQVVVDAKHKLIVDHELTNAVTDQHQLSALAVLAKETLGVESLEVVADTGYYDGEEVKACLEAEITPYVAKPHTSRNQKHGLFTKADFIYDANQDSYRCPAGAILTYRFSTVEDGRPQRYYATGACSSCALRAQCTRNKKGRRITRWEDEGILDAMAERIRARPDIMKQRKQIVEHPFGTMKRTMNQSYFLLRGLDKVRAEMSLTVLAYNLKRVITILGVTKLLEVVLSGVSNCVRLCMQLQIGYWSRLGAALSEKYGGFSHSLALQLTPLRVERDRGFLES